MRYQSTKTYGHDRGYSCAFRQWRAQSHCRLIHGYALGFAFVFEAEELDHRNWVVDFGGLKDLEAMLEQNFDHTTIVAEDDPHLEYFKQGHELGVLKLLVFPAGGCEKFAEYVWAVTEQYIIDAGYGGRVKLKQVEVREHAGNSARVVA
jgi:6-pyruvoyltetrahydropterin/6-carboxytetrahydropterin synthase